MWKTPWLAIRRGHVRFVSGSERVRCASGSGCVRCASGSGCVRFASGAGHFRFASGSERVRCASGAGCVRFASGAGHFRFASGSSVSGLRPVLGVSGLRPGRNMSGLRYGRIVSGLQVVGGLLVFFLLLRPDWLPPLGLLGCAGAGRRPRPRRNGARLPPPSSAPAVARCGAGAVVAFGGLDRHFAAVLFWGVSGEKELARATLGLGVAALVACVVCLLRWRRLRAEAEMRLWKLNAERRRRDMLCARAAAEGGGR